MAIPDSPNSSSEEPKKRKGGWPKGKKRKQDAVNSKAPKAPTTGYVLFLNERRCYYKDSHPELPFAEVTKLLGYEWSNLPHNDKKKYLDKAEMDKKRYREELKLYRQSEACQAVAQFKKSRPLPNVELISGPSESLASSLIEIDDSDEDSVELYCKICDQFFSSLHNKKEHFYGRQHLQAVTVCKESCDGDTSDPVDDGQTLLSESPTYECLSGSASLFSSCSQSITSSSNVNQAILDFMELSIGRETEMKELSWQFAEKKSQNANLLDEIGRLKTMETKLCEDIAALKAEETCLKDQLANLRMVPTLFGVIHFQH